MIYVFLSLLPYLCLAGTIWAFRLCPPSRRGPLFEAIINGALLWSLLVWLETNLYSFFNIVYPASICSFWLLYSGCLLYYLAMRRQYAHLARIRGRMQLIMAVICGLTLFVAVVYPPNMWDVLSYHLPRVMHWLQNHNLGPYITNIPRQIGMPPFNSMIALQSLAMEGGDYFVNLGQWFAFVGLIIGGVRIAAQLGASEKAQLFSGFFIATLPTAITQASNTESSNIVAFWILAMTSLLLEWLKSRDLKRILQIGGCIGLAILSKGSAYVTAFPFVVIIAWQCLRNPRALFMQGVWAALIIVCLNVPHLVRTYEAYGSIVGGTERNILPRPSPGHFVVNAFYNFLLHEPWLLKANFVDGWSGMARSLGVDENDSGAFPWGGIKNAQRRLILEEASAQNVIGALLLLSMGIAILLRKFRPPVLYTCAVGGTFFMYCLLLTWHPWASRIHTAMFALCAPLVGMYVESWKKSSWRTALTVVLLIWTFFVFAMFRRPLNIVDDRHRNFLYNSREALYFNNYPYIRPTYLRAAHYLAGLAPKSIGLLIYDDAFEYPLWAILNSVCRNVPKIVHIRNMDDCDKLKPEYVLVLGKGNHPDQPLALPFILKRENGAYVKVFPANNEKEIVD